jgi:copper(I)-binding protein
LAPTAWSAQLDSQDPWIRTAPPGSRILAGYVVLTNSSPKPVQLVGVSSTAFSGVEMHSTVIESSIARMERDATVTVPAGKSTRFEPSGRHLMLIDPKQKLTNGATVPITFTFDDGSSQVITFKMREGIDPTIDHDQTHDHLR